jgi:hypothetical protein
VEPEKVGLSSVEVVLKFINECGKKRAGMQPAGLSDGKNFFHFYFDTINSVPPDPDDTEKIKVLGRRRSRKKKKEKD